MDAKRVEAILTDAIADGSVGCESHAVLCARCHGEQKVERLATPEEVDRGCELGIAYNPCPDCEPL